MIKKIKHVWWRLVIAFSTLFFLYAVYRFFQDAPKWANDLVAAGIAVWVYNYALKKQKSDA